MSNSNERSHNSGSVIGVWADFLQGAAVLAALATSIFAILITLWTLPSRVVELEKHVGVGPSIQGSADHKTLSQREFEMVGQLDIIKNQIDNLNKSIDELSDAYMRGEKEIFQYGERINGLAKDVSEAEDKFGKLENKVILPRHEDIARALYVVHRDDINADVVEHFAKEVATILKESKSDIVPAVANELKAHYGNELKGDAGPPGPPSDSDTVASILSSDGNFLERVTYKVTEELRRTESFDVHEQALIDHFSPKISNAIDEAFSEMELSSGNSGSDVNGSEGNQSTSASASLDDAKILRIIESVLEDNKGTLRGPQGERGPPGEIAEVDFEGLAQVIYAEYGQSLKGDKGDVGPRGPRGYKGDAGLNGERGPQGPTGPSGDMPVIVPDQLTEDVYLIIYANTRTKILGDHYLLERISRWLDKN